MVSRVHEKNSVVASVFVGTSLDGYLARLDGRWDFLPPVTGRTNGYDRFFRSVDALVIGRKTYEVVLAFDAWPYGTKPVFVLSHRALRRPPPGAVVERLAGDPGTILSRLGARGFRHVYVDGGLTIQEFLRAGKVQRLVVAQAPVLIGSGVRLFGMVPRDIRLRHVATRVLAGGLVQSEYQVRSGSRRRALPSIW